MIRYSTIIIFCLITAGCGNTNFSCPQYDKELTDYLRTVAKKKSVCKAIKTINHNLFYKDVFKWKKYRQQAIEKFNSCLEKNELPLMLVEWYGNKAFYNGLLITPKHTFFIKISGNEEFKYQKRSIGQELVSKTREIHQRPIGYRGHFSGGDLVLYYFCLWDKGQIKNKFIFLSLHSFIKHNKYHKPLGSKKERYIADFIFRDILKPFGVAPAMGRFTK